MELSIIEVLRRYVRREASLDELRRWLALNEPELPEDELWLADEVTVALVHLSDGYADENDFRSRITSLVWSHSTAATDFVIGGDQNVARIPASAVRGTSVGGRSPVIPLSA